MRVIDPSNGPKPQPSGGTSVPHLHRAGHGQVVAISDVARPDEPGWLDVPLCQDCSGATPLLLNIGGRLDAIVTVHSNTCPWIKTMRGARRLP